VLEGRWRLGERSEEGQFDLVRAREGGLTAEVLATFVSHQRHGDPLRQSSDAGGLSAFGRDLVRECGRLGILLDVSHLAPKGVADVLERSGRPVVATHANAHAVHAHPRNLTDEQLEGIAASGGVVGVVPVPPFLGPYQERAPLAPLLRHLDHLIAVLGDDHVGIGMDFDGVGAMRTEGVEDVSRLPVLTEAMLTHGYTPERITKVLGANFLRVFDEVFGG
jgi:membrane dipeptidase